MKEALKLALEALELSAVTVDSFGVQKKTNKAIIAIKEALAQPEQEPVEDVVAYHSDGTRTVRIAPKRPWAGLTEDEIIAVDMYTLRVRGDGYTYARAIEDKLKELNI